MTKPSLTDLLSEVRNQQAIIRHAGEQVDVLIGKITDMVPSPLSHSSPSERRPKALVRWIDWLKENGPALRKDVAGGTGCNLSQAAMPHVRQWKEHMEGWEDDQLPADTLMSIQAIPSGLGRPPVIFFLWSQRYQLLSQFGVGPSQPPVTMTGVIGPTDYNTTIFPPDNGDPLVPQNWNENGYDILSPAEVKEQIGVDPVVKEMWPKTTEDTDG